MKKEIWASLHAMGRSICFPTACMDVGTSISGLQSRFPAFESPNTHWVKIANNVWDFHLSDGPDCNLDFSY